jgi:S-adenosylmethionine synthetase
MTIEAYHGKNNKNHVGKLYSKWAFERAKELYEKTGKYTEVILVSKIGKPITDYEEYINER